MKSPLLLLLLRRGEVTRDDMKSKAEQCKEEKEREGRDERGRNQIFYFYFHFLCFFIPRDDRDRESKIPLLRCPWGVQKL